MTDLRSTAAELRKLKISCLELVEESLRIIARLNPELNAFLTVTAEPARAQAVKMDAELAKGLDRGPLHGIPIAHKDLIRTQGVRTTAGSRIFAGYIPKRDAEIVSRLRQGGAVSLGKTSLHELAYGITSDNPHYGPVRNPWDPRRISGGSSGGSAVAVATGMVFFATGTDTGGSIRIPASFCGIVGLKPTFGRVSARGVLPLGFSQDHVGPMTRTVRDCAIAFQAMVDDPTGYVPPPDANIRGVRIGWPKTYFFERLAPEVRDSVQRARHTAESAGARLVELAMPDMEALRHSASIILLVEAAAALRPYLDRRDEFGPDVLALLDKGRAVPGIDYLEAQRTRRRIGHEFARLWDQADCIFTATTPTTAPVIGQNTTVLNGVSEDVRQASTRYTRGMNALGLPAISIPCGWSPAGLPIGLQIIAPARQEDRLLRIAAAMEDALAVGRVIG